MEIIELREEESLSLPKDSFDETSALTLYHNYKNRIIVEFPNPVNEQCYIIRSNGYVGYIPINENYSLRILPKVSINNVFRMLEYAYNLRSFALFEGSTSVEAIEDLFERLAAILAKRVINRSRKGLYLDYLERREALPHLVGRPDLISTTVSLLRGSTNAICEYEEHTADLEDNQILAWTLYQLRRFHIKRKDVQILVRKAFRELVHKVDIKHIEPQLCINRLYHRLNQDYKPMHGLCRFFLEHSGPGIEKGEHEFLPFILNMPNLFESFVAEWLLKNLPTGIRLEKQYYAQLSPDGKFYFNIDLVLIDARTDKVIAVLDTKYKRKADPEDHDIEQIVAYAISMNTKDALLVYPSPHTNNFDFKVGDNVRVVGLSFDIGSDPDEAGKEFLCQLKKELFKEKYN
jgi:5-methylcytosine-specific restriction enzyme subunit McrC